MNNRKPVNKTSYEKETRNDNHIVFTQEALEKVNMLSEKFQTDIFQKAVNVAQKHTNANDKVVVTAKDVIKAASTK